ncbi:Oidioi.mRNA.OKI2018_I69.chr2.g7527.t1.cds [Oikopleura dioica]|uniref:Oidioi.mRNA.OKI2018_I69.chr2.g7527.t1.cds n=1 Tax=Oikopleura dioica TaxID=34765 RepID=A0ABN7TA32_OIKDI|nr:Oidioi.mRNA.OKI2018_I69.chr2.g7527.t1.cds [Oikopleura dioica]
MLLKSTYLLDESGVSFIITRDEESAFIALTIEGTVRKFSTCPFSAHEVQHSTPGVTVVRTMCERIVSGSLDGSVTVLNKDCRTDHVCKGHNYPITALNLFKNGKSSSDITAMSADQSGQVRIWTLLSGRCQFVLGNYSGMISNVWPCRTKEDQSRCEIQYQREQLQNKVDGFDSLKAFLQPDRRQKNTILLTWSNSKKPSLAASR